MSPVILRDVSAVPRDDTRLRAEYAALTEGAGAIVLPDPGILRVEGRDRAKWLHNLVTVNVETMQEGSAAYALLLEAKGHVVADFVLLKQAEYFLLYTSRAAHQKLYANLRRAIFREKVTLTDASEQFGIISLQGPQATACLAKSFQLPTSNFQIPNTQSLNLPISNPQSLLIPNPRISTRFDLLAPRAAIPALRDSLVASGATQIGLDALNIARVEAGIPQFGDDFDETTLAPEARLDAFIVPDKGCYPGQETIARIRNLGHVNRLLVQLQITTDQSPNPGDLIFADGKEIGNVTSAVWSFAHNAPLALGYTRRETAEPGTRVHIANGDARLDATITNVHSLTSID